MYSNGSAFGVGQAPADDQQNGSAFGVGSPFGVGRKPLVRRHADPGTDPLSGVKAVFGGAGRAIGEDASKALDLLGRPGMATEAAIAGGLQGKGLGALGHAGDVFLHSEDGDDLQRDRDTIKSAAHIKGAIDMLPSGLPRGLADAAVDTLLDPTTYVGGLGLLDRAVTAGGRAALPAFARALHTLEAAGGQQRSAARALRQAYEFANYKGGTKLDLARRNGAEGLDQFKGLKSINNARRTAEEDLSNELGGRFNEITKGLKPDEEDALYRAVHTGTVDQLPDALKPRAAAFSTLTDTLAHLSGNRQLRANLAAKGFELPDWAKRFDTQIRSLQSPSQYREHYVPTAAETKVHDLGGPYATTEEMNERVSGGVNSLRDLLELRNEARPDEHAMNTAKAKDVHLEERSNPAELLDPETQRGIIANRLKTGARAITARDAERHVNRLFGVGGFSKIPAPAKAFFQETWSEPGASEFWENIAKGAKGAIDIPKVGLFALPFRHMANIGTLSVFADPSLANVFGTAGKFARLLTAGHDLDKRAGILGDAQKFGVTGVPSIDRAAGWVGKIPGVGDLYKASSHVLWSFDDAAKATRFDRLRRLHEARGASNTAAAYRAADQVGAELIDYSNRSPLTQALSYIAPFATFRSKLPGAVARTAVRHPERLLAATRAMPGLSGDNVETEDNRLAHISNPITDALEMVQDPARYARSTLGPPEDAIGSALGIDLRHGRNFLTDGTDPGEYALSSTIGLFPGGDQLTSALGINPFNAKSFLDDLVRGQTGVSVR